MHVDVQARVSGAPPPARVRRMLARVARATRCSRSREVSVLFCADSRMRSLNRRFRGKDRPTDVLAFPAAPSDGFLGDVVISVPYAAREARRRAEPPARSIDRLLVHGFLHLLGYDHETDEGQMEALEGRLRRKLGIADPARSERHTPRGAR